MSASVMPVCLSARISQKRHVRYLPSFRCALSVAVTWSSCGGVICYVLPVLWLTSCLCIMAIGTSDTKSMHVESDSPGGRTGPMAMFDVYDCLVCLSVAIYSSFLPARRYASAGVLLAMALCLCLSQVGVLSKRLKKIGLVFDMGASFDSYTVL